MTRHYFPIFHVKVRRVIQSIYRASDHSFWMILSIEVILYLYHLFTFIPESQSLLFRLIYCIQLITFLDYACALITWYREVIIFQSSVDLVISHQSYQSVARRLALLYLLGSMILSSLLLLLIKHHSLHYIIYCQSSFFTVAQLISKVQMSHTSSS